MRRTRWHGGLIAAMLILVALGSALLAMGCRRSRNGAAEASPTEEAAVPVDVIEALRGDLREEIEVTGTVEALQEVAIGCAASDRIVFIAGEEGDRVRAGQVLVRLDTSDLDANIAQAQTQVEAARIRLEQAKEGHEYVGISTQSGIDAAKAQLEAAKARLRQAETARELTARGVDDGIAAAETRLEQARAQLEQARSAYEQTDRATNASIAAAEAALRSAENAYEDLRRGARSQEREQAQEAVRQAELRVENARRDLQRMVALKEGGAVSQQTVDGVRLQYDTAVSQLEQARQALSLIREGPTQEQLRIAEAQVEQARAGLETARAARNQVEGQRQAVRTAEQGVAAAEIALRDAQNKRLTVDTSTEDIAAAREAVAQAQAAFDQASAGKITVRVDEKEIQAARTQLESARAAVSILQAQRAKRIVHSPVDGVISQKHMEVGEIAPMGGGAPILTIVTDDALQFAATVSELVVDRVHVGDPVSVTVDGLPDEAITGRVLSVLPAGDVASRNFTIKISLPGDRGVKPGMFARGRIQVSEARGVIVVPKDVLLEREGVFMVYVVEDGIARRREVMTGLEAVGVVEIVDGIEAGEQVVLRGKESLSEGVKVTVSGTETYEIPGSDLLSAAPEAEKVPMGPEGSPADSSEGGP